MYFSDGGSVDLCCVQAKTLLIILPRVIHLEQQAINVQIMVVRSLRNHFHQRQVHAPLPRISISV